jgi:tetratricopeptide (TPR) repeat protein
MNASVYSVQNGLKTTAQATIVNEAGLLDGVDALARKIVTEQSPYFSQRFAQLAGVTTKSFAALKAYLQGESKLRHAQDFSAKDDFETAVAEDSTFALAWYRLSQMAGAANLAEPAQYAAERATYWSRPLSKRYQQLLQANDAMLRGASALAERLYRDLTFAYPDDIEAWIGLGRTLFYYNPLHGRSMLESRAAFEAASRLDDSHIWTKVFLMNLAVIEPNAAVLDSLVDVLYGKNSNHVSTYWRVSRALIKNDHSAWQQVVADLRKESDFGVATTTFWAARAWLNGPFFYFENVPSPKDLAYLLTASPRSPEYRGLGHLYLAQFELLQGKWQAAQKEIRNLALLNPAWSNEYRALYSVAPFFEAPPSELAKLRDDLQAWDAASAPPAMEPLLSLAAHNGIHAHLRLYLLGMLSARLQVQKEVERYAAELVALPVPQRAGSLPNDLALNLRAEWAQRRGQQAEALALLEQQKMEVWYDLPWGSPFFGQILARFQRAELLASLGRYDEALNWYNTTVYYPPDWILLAPTYLRRAKIYEKLGRKEEAIEHYRRFIRMWKDCDPELQPTLEQAQKSLAKLREEPQSL